MWLINKLSRPTKRQLLIYQPLYPPHHHDHSRHARLHEQYLNRALSGHDGVMIWKRFPHCKTFVRRAHRSPLELPHNGTVMRNFDVFLVQNIKQRVQQSVDLPVIWDSNTLLWRHCNGIECHFSVQIVGTECLWNPTVRLPACPHNGTLSNQI